MTTAAASLQTIRFPQPAPYGEVYALQRERRDAIEGGEAGNALFLLEHTPVFTLGRNAREEHLLQRRDALARMGIDVVDVDRGGDVTYHGPGQLVAYPILNLTLWRRSIDWYLRMLEEVLIDVLNDYGLAGERAERYTGVWAGGAKVAAIGVAIHQWVTYHGVALNVCPNMEHWGLIVPCGIPDKPVTSMERLLGRAPAMDEVTGRFEHHFRRWFFDEEGRPAIRLT